MYNIGVLERLYAFLIEFSNIVMYPINIIYQSMQYLLFSMLS